jgi:hypothetical protein
VILTPVPLLLSLAALRVPDATIRGRCVESRTASVFAGACHYGAEATTGGREALLALTFESGAFHGVDLSGVQIAAAIAGEGNLADPSTARRSILYASETSDPIAARAAEDLLRERFGAVLGTVAGVRAVPLRVRLDGDHYRVEAGALFEIDGALLPDRACCKMPYQVWYRPFLELRGSVVGCNDVFRYRDPTLGPTWERFEENTAFAGAFEFRPEAPASVR